MLWNLDGTLVDSAEYHEADPLTCRSCGAKSSILVCISEPVTYCPKQNFVTVYYRWHSRCDQWVETC